eukprot:GHVU01179339.1.p1 GENE.GHVU01179339.1~~GHVU01179339.1.p1  ORF type:complete len:131 (-),score=2.48 GHVU01179339.1:105-497(-)
MSSSIHELARTHARIHSFNHPFNHPFTQTFMRGVVMRSRRDASHSTQLGNQYGQHLTTTHSLSSVGIHSITFNRCNRTHPNRLLYTCIAPGPVQRQHQQLRLLPRRLDDWLGFVGPVDGKGGGGGGGPDF